MNILNRILLFIAARFVEVVSFFYTLVARFFGYPINPGMDTIKPETVTTFFEASEYRRYFPPLESQCHHYHG